jgi:hypothetical protein
MPVIQKKALSLTGLMYANVNVWSAAERGKNATNSDVWNLSKTETFSVEMMTNDDFRNLSKPDIQWFYLVGPMYASVNVWR